MPLPLLRCPVLVESSNRLGAQTPLTPSQCNARLGYLSNTTFKYRRARFLCRPRREVVTRVELQTGPIFSNDSKTANGVYVCICVHMVCTCAYVCTMVCLMQCRHCNVRGIRNQEKDGIQELTTHTRGSFCSMPIT